VHLVSSRDRRSCARLGTAACLCVLAAASGGGAARSAATISACRGGGYDLGLTERYVGGNVLAVAGILNKASRPCAVATTLGIAVHYHFGNIDPRPVRPVRGNPARWHVSRVLQPWSQVVHTWTWRNWCGRPRHESLELSGRRGTSEQLGQRINAPVCRDRKRMSAFVDTGAGTRLVPLVERPIPAHLLSPNVPIPVSPTLIRVQNAWLVSDGRMLVAVYAGEAGNDPSKGRFVVIRQSLVFGNQWEDVVSAGSTGAVRLTHVPLGATVETSAQRGELSFTSAGGRDGVLHLATDTVAIAP
jgi:hypothetical protein